MLRITVTLTFFLSLSTPEGFADTGLIRWTLVKSKYDVPYPMTHVDKTTLLLRDHPNIFGKIHLPETTDPTAEDARRQLAEAFDVPADASLEQFETRFSKTMQSVADTKNPRVIIQLSDWGPTDVEIRKKALHASPSEMRTIRNGYGTPIAVKELAGTILSVLEKANHTIPVTILFNASYSGELTREIREQLRNKPSFTPDITVITSATNNEIADNIDFPNTLTAAALAHGELAKHATNRSPKWGPVFRLLGPISQVGRIAASGEANRHYPEARRPTYWSSQDNYGDTLGGLDQGAIENACQAVLRELRR